jgi:hypothetical protein
VRPAQVQHPLDVLERARLARQPAVHTPCSTVA